MSEIKEFFNNLFDSTSWPARWHCGYWSDFHGWQLAYDLSSMEIIAYILFYKKQRMNWKMK